MTTFASEIFDALNIDASDIAGGYTDDNGNFINTDTGEIENAGDENTDAQTDGNTSPFICKVATEIGNQAVSFLARYDAVFKMAENTNVGDAVHAILLAAAQGELVPEDPNAGYEVATSFVSQLMRQSAQVVFYELYGRELRRRREQDSLTAPQFDATQHTPAMMEFLARLQGQRVRLEGQATPSINPTETGTDDKEESDADTIKMSTDSFLKDTLIDIHEYLAPIHQQLMACRYGEDLVMRPDFQGLGFGSIKLPDGSYAEFDNLDDAYQAFVLQREERQVRRRANQQKAAANVLKALIRN